MRFHQILAEADPSKADDAILKRDGAKVRDVVIKRDKYVQTPQKQTINKILSSLDEVPSDAKKIQKALDLITDYFGKIEPTIGKIIDEVMKGIEIPDLVTEHVAKNKRGEVVSVYKLNLPKSWLAAIDYDMAKQQSDVFKTKRTAWAKVYVALKRLVEAGLLNRIPTLQTAKTGVRAVQNQAIKVTTSKFSLRNLFKENVKIEITYPGLHQGGKTIEGSVDEVFKSLREYAAAHNYEDLPKKIDGAQARLGTLVRSFKEQAASKSKLRQIVSKVWAPFRPKRAVGKFVLVGLATAIGVQMLNYLYQRSVIMEFHDIAASFPGGNINYKAQADSAIIKLTDDFWFWLLTVSGPIVTYLAVLGYHRAKLTAIKHIAHKKGKPTATEICAKIKHPRTAAICQTIQNVAVSLGIGIGTGVAASVPTMSQDYIDQVLGSFDLQIRSIKDANEELIPWDQEGIPESYKIDLSSQLNNTYNDIKKKDEAGTSYIELASSIDPELGAAFKEELEAVQSTDQSNVDPSALENHPKVQQALAQLSDQEFEELLSVMNKTA